MRANKWKEIIREAFLPKTRAFAVIRCTDPAQKQKLSYKKTRNLHYYSNESIPNWMSSVRCQVEQIRTLPQTDLTATTPIYQICSTHMSKRNKRRKPSLHKAMTNPQSLQTQVNTSKHQRHHNSNRGSKSISLFKTVSSPRTWDFTSLRTPSKVNFKTSYRAQAKQVSTTKLR